ncbi:hypothetical protein [Amycolatopsis pigmentata]|uniref:Uncharacterized protein n=1 Tax=Amycolatopsis pigmentata TaxID=450801 RepID=A0ABW5FMX9_9PSEU
MCGAVFGLLKDDNAVSLPQSGLTGAESQRSLSKLLGDYAAMAGKAVNGLNALPASPDATAESAKKTFLNHYTVARDKASSAKATLDAASPSDFSALMSAANAQAACSRRKPKKAASHNENDRPPR